MNAKDGQKSLFFNTCLLVVIFIFFVAYFSPLIFTNHLIASGDGISYYLPNFYSKIELWDPLIASGFPITADPQAMTWYPVSMLFSGHFWNLFVITGYVLATFFMFQYAYFITGSFLGGIIAGFSFGLSGFMSAHVDHTSIIHSAVWLPLMLLAVEKVRLCGSIKWFTIGTLSFSFCCLAGHPQVFLYITLLCSGYAFIAGLSPSTRMARWKFYCVFAAMVCLSAGLAAIQLLPTALLAELSLRQQLSFTEFTSYSLPLAQLPGLLFPFLFGWWPASSYWQNYFGLPFQCEMVGYTGLITLLLACVGIASPREHMKTWFFLVVAVIAVLLALGSATPLAAIAYHIPLLNKFKAPARHLLEYTFAVSVLAGIGVAAIEKRSGLSKGTINPLLFGSMLILVVLTVVCLHSDQLQAMALAKGIEELSFLPWKNPALGIPTMTLFLALSVIVFWSLKPSSYLRCSLLAVVLLLDVGHYGWQTSVRYYPAVSGSVLTASDFADECRESLAKENQRILPLRGWGILTDIPPNLSKLWHVPSAGFYGPLMISRVSTLMRMTYSGHVYGQWFDSLDQSLDIMAVKYVLDSQDDSENVTLSLADDDSRWAAEDRNLMLGIACGDYPFREEMSFKLMTEFESTGIGIVSSLVCSNEIKDSDGVVKITAKDSAGRILSKTLRAGRDSSEWAHGCKALSTPIQHAQARIFDARPHGDCEGHRYVSILPFDGLYEIREVKLQWIGSAGGILIDKISLLNDVDQQTYPIKSSTYALGDPERWRKVKIDGLTSVYENMRARPRAWLVPEVLSASDEEILKAITASRLPNGQPFDAARMALVEKPLAFKVDNFDKKASAEIVSIDSSKVKIQTRASSPSFLVLSDVNYPGWGVTVDGTRQRLFQTNYILRGVVVPAGEHLVIFEYRPTVFYIGLAISALGMLSTLLIVIQRKRLKKILGIPHP